jgi:two-component system NtrC family sensor kinase
VLVQHNRDHVARVAAAAAVAVTLLVLAESAAWVGRPFAGFLLLGNRVVASAGLVHWPAIASGEVFQQEIVSVDGRPLRDARELRRYVEARPIGSSIAYELRAGDALTTRSIETRRFSGVDYALLFGSYLASGIALLGAALAIRFLGRGAARSSALPLYIVGLYAITAVDLYGPYRLFRLHALLEGLLFAAVLHFAAVFPFRRAWLVARPRMIGVPYLLGGLLEVVMQMELMNPQHYATMHRIAIGAFGAALPILIASQVFVYVRPPSFEARQRVKLVAAGAVAALLGPIVLALASALSQGRSPENLAGWTAALFPASIAYAVLQQDLLGVDAILRRLTSYVLISALTAGAFAGSVLGVELLLQRTFEITGREAAVLLSALAVAALLPVRDRLQSSIDRLFSRSSVDFRRLLEEAGRRFARAADLESIRRGIEEVVDQALQPESARLEIRAKASADESTGAPAEETEALRDVEGGGLVVPFSVDGRVLARHRLGRRLSGRSYGADERRLLSSLADQGALALAKALALEQLRELNENLERIVEQRTAELGATLATLHDAQRHMAHQEKMASLGQLVAGVAHEINNPLHFVEGNLQFLHDYAAALSAAVADYEAIVAQSAPQVTAQLRNVREQHDLDWALKDLPSVLAACREGVQRTALIVRDLRTFSRADSGRRSEVELATSLDATLNVLQGRLVGIHVRREYGETPPVECIEGQLGQVFMNLLVNAADALGERGTIVVRTSANGADRVLVEIEDDGPGIPPDVLSRVFEPFFTTKEVGKGTGLGLALSYGIVARHGGELRVQSEVGRGTCFTVDLPVRLAAPAAQPDSTSADTPIG